MIVMFVQHPSGFYHNQIAQAIRVLGEECLLVSWMHFDARMIDKLSPQRDLVFFRTGAVQALQIARKFEERGFHLLNDSRYIAISAQKFIANLYAGSNGVPVPELSVAVDKANQRIVLEYLRQYGTLVAKPIYSRDQGRFVFRITAENVGEALNLVATIPGEQILLQNEIRFSRIVRAIVLGKKMLVEATTFDVKHPPDWKATVCMNPKASHYRDVPIRLVNLAERTSTVFGGDVAYIDFFEQASGDYVLSEINHSCGLQHHEKITGIPIREHIAGYLVSRYRQIFPKSSGRNGLPISVPDIPFDYVDE